MKQASVYVYTYGGIEQHIVCNTPLYVEAPVRKFVGSVCIEGGFVNMIQGKEEDYKHFTFPLSSIMMIRWENTNDGDKK